MKTFPLAPSAPRRAEQPAPTWRDDLDRALASLSCAVIGAALELASGDISPVELARVADAALLLATLSGRGARFEAERYRALGDAADRYFARASARALVLAEAAAVQGGRR